MRKNVLVWSAKSMKSTASDALNKSLMYNIVPWGTPHLMERNHSYCTLQIEFYKKDKFWTTLMQHREPHKKV